MRKFINKFNDWLAEKLSFSLSTMTMFYVIFILTIFPLFTNLPTTAREWAQYLCTVIFQGIALPVIGYTAKKAGDKTDKMMDEMYKMTKHIERLTEHIDNDQHNIEKEVEQILEKEK